MEIKNLNEFSRTVVDQLLAAVPFFKTVKQQSPWQYAALLQHSRIVYFLPGEVVFHYGEKDNWLYFLLKGLLTVYVRDDITAAAVNYITPGEVFGDLAMLAGNERTATLIANPNCPQVMMAIGTDFTIFGELDDFRMVNLQTKLAYYRNSVHSLRWKLEVYRGMYPHHPLADNHHKVRLHSGKKDGLAELNSLYSQAIQLARLLRRWNREIDSAYVSAPAL